MPIYFYETTIGRIGISEAKGVVTNLYFEHDQLPPQLEISETDILKEAARQLRSYLAGELKEFSLPLAPLGTDFMKQVWGQLNKIPYGETTTYQAIAQKNGVPRAVRAVGLANNRNPIPILIPCHRVIGSNGLLTGYRGGLGLKEKLLAMEKMKNSPGFFVYGQTETEYLKSKDKRLAAVIDKIGMIQRETITDPFSALISSIVSQQISNKAAATVWERLQRLLGNITPESIADREAAAIQSCGLSNRKVSYIKGVAEAAISGTVDFNNLHMLSDGEIIKSLSALHGVGVWTAEMLLIFSLNRPNVVSYRDLAIRRGMMNLYGLKELTKERFAQYQARYSPYGSVAALYLWEISLGQSI